MTRFSLDANVLVYAADRTAGERHERALHILDRAVRRDCVLTLQALAEFFYVTTRKRMVARTEAAAQLRDWTTEFPTISADAEALWTALELDRATARFGLVGRAPPGHGRADTAVTSC